PDGHEARPRAVVGMIPRFREAEHRREAGIRALERLAPLVARFCLEGALEQGFHLRPAGAIVLAGELVLRNLQPGKELLEEAGFDRPDGDEFAVLRLVDVVPGRAGIEDVRAALLGPRIG